MVAMIHSFSMLIAAVYLSCELCGNFSAAATNLRFCSIRSTSHFRSLKFKFLACENPHLHDFVKPVSHDDKSYRRRLYFYLKKQRPKIHG